MREADSAAVDSTIAAGSAPRAPPRDRGLLLTIPGRRQGLRLIDAHGSLTPNGTYYYETTGHAAPNKGFDYNQVPIRRGARVQIKLLDGSSATAKTWDGVKRQWHFTKIGQRFYRDSQDSYVVTCPVNMSLVRLNGSIYSDASVLKSTATSLGEIKLPSLMPDDDQLAEVRRLTEQFVANLRVDDEGQRVIIEGGGSQTRMTLDTERAVEYNKEDIIIQQDGSMTVDAVLHRPLRAARPWSFGFRGVCPEAFDPTEGKCVSHQLAAVLEKQLNLQESDMDWQ